MQKADRLTFSAEDKEVKEILFSTLKYKIPQYQRPYSWGDDEIEEFWIDLENNISSYFLGSFVLNYEDYDKEEYIEIIDGQQRVLTITILMAVLRDLANQIEDHELSKWIQEHCICFKDIRGNETYRVLCGESTRPFFENHIQKSTSDISSCEPNTKEQKKIFKNYNILKDKVVEELLKRTDKETKSDFIRSLYDKVSKIKVIRIRIESEEDAYEIFETVNARGVDLSVSDLLKNLIFKNLSKSGENKLKEIKVKWSTMEKNITDSDIDMTKFLRHFWLSRYEFVTEKKLFKSIKNESDLDYEKLLDDLFIASVWYRRLVLCEIETSEKWIDVGKNYDKIYNSAVGIKMMNANQCYVLFLSILRNLDKLDTDPTRIFNLIEKFTFNYSSICSHQTNRLERIYSSYAREIEKIIKNTKEEKNVGKNIQTLFNKLEVELKKLRPDREEFLIRFMDVSYGKSEKNRKLVSYILAKINEGKTTGENKINFQKVNIEHLIPQKPNSDWDLNPEDIKEFVNLLGNLTLLGEEFNSKGSNKILKEKIVYLERSDIKLTQEVVQKIKELNFAWSQNSIIERQKEFAIISYDSVWNF